MLPQLVGYLQVPNQAWQKPALLHGFISPMTTINIYNCHKVVRMKLPPKVNVQIPAVLFAQYMN
jgi:hypothetical protein